MVPSAKAGVVEKAIRTRMSSSGYVKMTEIAPELNHNRLWGGAECDVRTVGRDQDWYTNRILLQLKIVVH